ncbi:urease accessory protein UreE [Teredinibacter purpureus]|jgi:Urease accessory protein UreE|uniref:urease accessory protein UreE n=1 Tax=Teredinibacter purpureus TaxID=2731756 RepID=UPI0005F84DF9|nr:urease accessory protein UreE [Teredinibacter purpureus]
MLEAYEIKKDLEANDLEVVVTYEERKKSRHKVKTAQGIDLGWFLERGHVLEHGEFLQCKSGEVVRVIAAQESVSEVVSQNVLLLTRAAYHLGNRHVPLQIGEGFLRFLHDHVLDDMVRGLGLSVSHAHKPFHPENGAYHGSGGHHHHDH